MTEKIEHLFLNWNFLDKQDMYDAIKEALSEKDKCIKNFLTALEFQKIDDFMNKATPTDYLNLGTSYNETINDKLSEKDAEIERLKEQLRLCEQQATIKRNLGIEVQNEKQN